MTFRFYLFVLVIGLSCTKEDDLQSVNVYNSGTTDILYKLVIDENDNTTIIGGYVWSRGITIMANKDLSHLIIDSISNKGLFDVCVTSRHQLVAVGTDGYFFIKSDADKNWMFHRLQNWDILHHIIETKSGFLASGGKSYEHGYIYHINPDFRIDTAIYFGHEISEVKNISGEEYISVGFGNIQRSSNGGYTWKLLPNEGDFYSSCVFTDSIHGFIIGYNGTLLESYDGGNLWIKSTADIWGNGFNSFRKIVKVNSNELIITGNSGNIWRSTDVGKSWLKYNLHTNADIYDIGIKSDGKYLCIGSEGYIAEIEF